MRSSMSDTQQFFDGAVLWQQGEYDKAVADLVWPAKLHFRRVALPIRNYLRGFI